MPELDPELTPEQEARVRRLLVDARHGDPIPVDVAARLDRVLDQLGAEGPDDVEPAGEVVDLVARRRRRVTGLLVAAAAVVVLGVTVGQAVRSDIDLGSADESSRASVADDDSTLGSAEAGAAQGVLPEAAPSSSTQLGPTTGDTTRAGPVELSRKRFAEEVVRYRDVAGYEAADGERVGVETLGGGPSFLCQAADWGEGKLVAAVYGGLPTVLAYRTPSGSTQTVELLRCGTAEVLRSTVLAEP